MQSKKIQHKTPANETKKDQPKIPEIIVMKTENTAVSNVTKNNAIKEIEKQKRFEKINQIKQDAKMKNKFPTAGHNKIISLPKEKLQLCKIENNNLPASRPHQTKVNQMTKSQRLEKIKQIKLNKYQKAGKTEDYDLSKEIKIIEQKLTKTEITAGLQQKLDIEFAKNFNDWNDEWETNDIKLQKHEDSNMMEDVTKSNPTQYNKTKSVKRKLENEDETESQVLPKLIKIENVSNTASSNNKEAPKHQKICHKPIKTQTQMKSNPKTTPNLPTSRPHLANTQKQNPEEFQIEVEDGNDVIIEESSINSSKQEVQRQTSAPESPNQQYS